MALKTDDCDIRSVYFFMELGENGDYYINLVEYPKEDGENDDTFSAINYRMATSGGACTWHPEIKNAMAELFRAMEKAGLNDYPDNKNN